MNPEPSEPEGSLALSDRSSGAALGGAIEERLLLAA